MDFREKVVLFTKEYRIILQGLWDFEDVKEHKKKELESKFKDDRITKTTLKEELAKIELEIDNAKKVAYDQIKEMANMLKEELLEISQVSGEQINDHVVKLLNSGIDLNLNEFKALTDRFNSEHNFTMLRLLDKYAKAHEIPTIVPRIDERLEAFDYLLDVTKKGIMTKEITHCSVILKGENHLNKLIKGFTDEFQVVEE